MKKTIIIVLFIISIVFLQSFIFMSCANYPAPRKDTKVTNNWVKFHQEDPKIMEKFLVENIQVNSGKVYEVTPQVFLDIYEKQPKIFRFRELENVSLDTVEKKESVIEQEQIFGEGMEHIQVLRFENDERGGVYSVYETYNGFFKKGTIVYVFPIDENTTQVAIYTTKNLLKKYYTSQEILEMIRTSAGLVEVKQ